MRATFIGHQTWLIEYKSTKILIDPLICEDFGLVDGLRIDVYPPRTVNADALDDVDLIFLSHEHSDHFDIKSLNLLPRTAKFFLGGSIVNPVKECVRKLGFQITEINSSDPIQVKDLILRFYPADPKTAFWENRVTQILVETSTENDGGIFIAVDALVSEVFKRHLKEGGVKTPKLVVVSNNSRISPPGAFQSLENWRGNSSDSTKKTGPFGIGVLSSVVTSYVDDFPDIPENIAICGGGFIKRIGNFAAFPFSEQPSMSALANSLSLDVNVVGLLPGEFFDLNDVSSLRGSVDWIQVNRIQHKFLTDELQDFIENRRSVMVVGSVLDDYERIEDFEFSLRKACKELRRIRKPLLLFITGKKALALKSHLGRPLDSRRIAFFFRSDNLRLSSTYALNFITGEFEEDRGISESDAIIKYPYGVSIPLVDFVGMFEGDLQIWDIVGVSVKSWFEGGIFEGLIPFFYSYYGENGSPELLGKIINRELVKMGVTR
ncbi:MBL fold metallo-hydrolase [Burkholderia sp. Tr-20390]|uniref:MBL fold metallo-hydrolase n=1 Tax=Burkholderia sp. Tr-20390 TaxID=2703904 RepID=UPI001981728A|nr:MBL fold metallo-hydrolase [Burkholderia sp. Tr-20390]